MDNSNRRRNKKKRGRGMFGDMKSGFLNQKDSLYARIQGNNSSTKHKMLMGQLKDDKFYNGMFFVCYIKY